MNQQELKKLETRLQIREDALLEREALADNAKELEVMVKRLEALQFNRENKLREAESRLKDIEVAVADAQLILEGTQKSIIGLEQIYASRKDILQSTIDSLMNEHLEVKASLTNIKEELVKRKHYLVEQEVVIEKTVEKGNDRILELRDMTGSLEDKIKTLEVEYIAKTSKLENRIFELEKQKDERLDEVEYAGVLLANLETEITKKRGEVKEVKVEYTNVLKETSRLQDLLKQKESSLLIKIDTIRKEREELEVDKRRWNSTKSLYNDV